MSNNTLKPKRNIPEVEHLKNRIAMLEEESRSFEEIISILPGHIYWKNKKGILVGCNNEQAKSAGLKSRNEIVGLKPIDLIKKNLPQKERERQAKAIEEVDKNVINNDVSVVAEETAILSDGSLGYFLSSKVPLHTKSGEVKGLAGVTLDITDLKILEKQLDQANKNKSHFIINVGTFIRDSLSSLIGMSELLNQTNLSEKQKRCVDVISESTEKIIPLLNRMYDYVDLADNTLAVNKNAFNLKDFFNVIVLEFEQSCRDKSLKFSFNYDATLPKWVESSSYFLSQILRNLLKNSIKYTESGEIKFSVIKLSPLAKDHFDLEIKIEDTGRGISEEVSRNLFKLFDGSTEQDHLLIQPDLELSLSAKMLELIEGTIAVKSKIGVGTVFTIKLPLVKASPLSNNTQFDYNPSLETYKEPTACKSKNRLIKILVIDHDPLWQKSLKLMLEEAYNCQIDQIDDISKLSINSTNKYNIILSDVGSSAGDYLAFLKKYKLKHKNVPIVIITACASDEQQEKINETGITDLVIKPVGYKKLIEIIDFHIFQD